MTTEKQPDEEITLNFDDRSEPITLRRPDSDVAPGAHAGEAVIEVDPLVEKYLSSPYDPVLGGMMMGRATGEAVKSAPRSGWMRTLTWFLALALLIEGFYGFLYIFGLEPAAISMGGGLLLTSSTILLSGPFLAAGILLAWRLLRH